MGGDLGGHFLGGEGGFADLELGVALFGGGPPGVAVVLDALGCEVEVYGDAVESQDGVDFEGATKVAPFEGGESAGGGLEVVFSVEVDLVGNLGGIVRVGVDVFGAGSGEGALAAAADDGVGVDVAGASFADPGLELVVEGCGVGFDGVVEEPFLEVLVLDFDGLDEDVEVSLAWWSEDGGADGVDLVRVADDADGAGVFPLVDGGGIDGGGIDGGRDDDLVVVVEPVLGEVGEDFGGFLLVFGGEVGGAEEEEDCQDVVEVFHFHSPSPAGWSLSVTVYSTTLPISARMNWRMMGSSMRLLVAWRGRVVPRKP